MNAENICTHSKSFYMMVCISPLDIGKAIYYRKFKNFKIKPKYFSPLRSFTIMSVLLLLEIRFPFIRTLHFKKSSIVLVQPFQSKAESKL